MLIEEESEVVVTEEDFGLVKFVIEENLKNLSSYKTIKASFKYEIEHTKIYFITNILTPNADIINSILIWRKKNYAKLYFKGILFLLKNVWNLS